MKHVGKGPMKHAISFFVLKCDVREDKARYRLYTMKSRLFPMFLVMMALYMFWHRENIFVSFVSKNKNKKQIPRQTSGLFIL